MPQKMQVIVEFESGGLSKNPQRIMARIHEVMDEFYEPEGYTLKYVVDGEEEN